MVALRTLALIEEGVAPAKILMVTFSEKAKEEMALRVKSFAQGRIYSFTEVNIDDIQIETFNSWGQHVLDEYYSLLGFTAKPELVDDITKKISSSSCSAPIGTFLWTIGIPLCRRSPPKAPL